MPDLIWDIGKGATSVRPHIIKTTNRENPGPDSKAAPAFSYALHATQNQHYRNLGCRNRLIPGHPEQVLQDMRTDTELGLSMGASWLHC